MNPRMFLFAGAAVTVAAAFTLGEALAQTLGARFERNPIRADETVRLNVEAGAAADGAQPDVEPLRRDFEILGQSSSTQITIENGRRSTRTRWIFELAPKRTGRLTAGPLQVGAMTSPAIVLEVLPAPAADEASSARDVFIETDVAPEDVYVQSQLTYTIRIYRAVEFLEAVLSEFAPEGAVTHRLGKDATYTKVIDGRRYRVIERRFAVFPPGERAPRPARGLARRAHRRWRRRVSDESSLQRGTPDAPRLAAGHGDGETPPRRRRDAMASGPRGDLGRRMARGPAPTRGGRTGDLDVAPRRRGARPANSFHRSTSRISAPSASIPISRPS